MEESIHKRILNRLDADEKVSFGVSNSGLKLMFTAYAADLSAAIFHFEKVLDEAKSKYSFEIDRDVDYSYWGGLYMNPISTDVKTDTLQMSHEYEDIALMLIDTIPADETQCRQFATEDRSLWKEAFANVAGNTYFDSKTTLGIISTLRQKLSSILFKIHEELRKPGNIDKLDALYEEMDKKYCNRSILATDSAYMKYKKWESIQTCEIDAERIDEYIRIRLRGVLDQEVIIVPEEDSPSAIQISEASKKIEKYGLNDVDKVKYAQLLRYVEEKDGIYSVRKTSSVAKYFYLHRGEVKEPKRQQFFEFIRTNEIVAAEKLRLEANQIKEDKNLINKVINGDYIEMIEELKERIRMNFLPKKSNKYDWIVVLNILKQEGVVRSDVSNADFKRLINHPLWFPDTISSKAFSDHSYAQSGSPDKWTVPVGKENQAKHLEELYYSFAKPKEREAV